MKPINRQINNKSAEQQLETRLKYTFISIISITAIIILSFTVFAPAFGSIFKIFSSNTDTQELIIKPSKPIVTIDNNFTNQESITIKGFGQAGNEIKLYVNGPEVMSTIIDTSGLFEFNGVNLISGRNTLFVKSIDSKGTQSDPSDTYTINLDKQEPKIDIESPKDKDNIKNLDSRITIKGSINEQSSLKINDQVAIIKPDLTFEHLLGVSEGDVEIKIVAIDQAGNEKEEIINVTYQKKSD